MAAMNNMFNRSLEFCSKLKMKMPIMVAPMANITNVNMVAEASKNGALGVLACGNLTPEQIKKQYKEIKELINDKQIPVGMNVFADYTRPKVSDNFKEIFKANANLKPFFEELNLKEFDEDNLKLMPSLDEQMEAILECKPNVLTYTFNSNIPIEFMEDLIKQNCKIIGTANTLQEAEEVYFHGATAVIAQGSEAGGHRASFMHNNTYDDKLIGTATLVSQISDKSIPVIASGGISDDRNVFSMLMNGAVACNIGTAFLVSEEANINENYRNLLLTKQATDLTVTRTFTGRFARGFSNELSNCLKKLGADDLNKEFIVAPFPIQQALTSEIRLHDKYSSLWAGQNFEISSKKFNGLKIKDILIDLMSLSNEVLE